MEVEAIWHCGFNPTHFTCLRSQTGPGGSLCARLHQHPLTWWSFCLVAQTGSAWVFAVPDQQGRGFSASFHSPGRALRGWLNVGLCEGPWICCLLGQDFPCRSLGHRQSWDTGRGGGSLQAAGEAQVGATDFGSSRRPAAWPGTLPLCAFFPMNKSGELPPNSLSLVKQGS